MTMGSQQNCTCHHGVNAPSGSFERPNHFKKTTEADRHSGPSPTEIYVFFSSECFNMHGKHNTVFQYPIGPSCSMVIALRSATGSAQCCTLGAARVLPGGNPEPPAVASTTFSTCGVAVRWQSVRSIYMEQWRQSHLDEKVLVCSCQCCTLTCSAAAARGRECCILGNIDLRQPN